MCGVAGAGAGTSMVPRVLGLVPVPPHMHGVAGAGTLVPSARYPQASPVPAWSHVRGVAGAGAGTLVPRAQCNGTGTLVPHAQCNGTGTLVPHARCARSRVPTWSRGRGGGACAVPIPPL